MYTMQDDKLQTQCAVQQGSSILNRYTFGELRLICSVLMGSVFNGVMVDLMIPFYETEAKSRLLPRVAVGAVESVFALTECATSPLFARMMPVLGASRTLYLGSALAGAATLTLAVLALVNTSSLFLILSCALRCVAALGSAALQTASMTTVAAKFPRDTNLLIGAVETAFWSGISIAPAVGGGLYSAGGLALPCVFLGTIILLVMPVFWCISPTVGSDTQHVPWLTMSRSLVGCPDVWLNLTVLVVVDWMWTGLDPFLALEALRAMGVSLETFGVYYMLSTGGAIFGGPAFGWASDRIGNSYPLMAASLLLAAASLVALSPAPWTGLQPSRALLATGLVLRDLALVGSYIPVYGNLLRCCTDLGLPDTLSTQALISGLTASCAALGKVVGPAVAGVLADAAGLPVTASVFAALTLALALLVAVQGACRCKDCRRATTPECTRLIS